MWDFSIAKALGLLIRTAPFLIFRALVYFGIAVAMVVVTGAGAGTAAGAGCPAWPGVPPPPPFPPWSA